MYCKCCDSYVAQKPCPSCGSQRVVELKNIKTLKNYKLSKK
ncbi:hypothetical protein [Wolinella succinogenes]|nr:hypothetical protein [Wolinella succinogenes]VEG80237.1 Uncharacterised protein [Wolinella succinogenes]